MFLSRTDNVTLLSFYFRDRKQKSISFRLTPSFYLKLLSFQVTIVLRSLMPVNCDSFIADVHHLSLSYLCTRWKELARHLTGSPICYSCQNVHAQQNMPTFSYLWDILYACTFTLKSKLCLPSIIAFRFASIARNIVSNYVFMEAIRRRKWAS